MVWEAPKTPRLMDSPAEANSLHRGYGALRVIRRTLWFAGQYANRYVSSFRDHICAHPRLGQDSPSGSRHASPKSPEIPPNRRQTNLLNRTNPPPDRARHVPVAHAVQLGKCGYRAPVLSHASTRVSPLAHGPRSSCSMARLDSAAWRGHSEW
jgi:hypothetical protein